MQCRKQKLWFPINFFGYHEHPANFLLHDKKLWVVKCWDHQLLPEQCDTCSSKVPTFAHEFINGQGNSKLYCSKCAFGEKYCICPSQEHFHKDIYYQPANPEW